MEIRYRIKKEMEGTYFSIPFEVPENVEKLTVSYAYRRPTRGLLSDLKPTNCIDLGLADERGNFLGWSGSSRAEVTVGKYESTEGYRRQEIKPGTWQILVGAYHVLPEGVEVTYTVTFTSPAPRWFFGDLHVHSTASDGKFNAWELADMAKKEGLDFLALANHNNFSLNFSLPDVSGLTFIPAVEWTHYKGHINLFGVKAPFENSFIANTKEEMDRLLGHARSLGAAVSVNHPKDHFCPYLWGDDDAFDLAEIWNGPMRPSNIKNIAYWTALLRQGKKPTAVGGSDYHKPGPVRLGHPVNGVYAASPAPADLLAAIRAGHCFVSESVKGPRISLRYGSAMMGDTAVWNASSRLTVELTSPYPVSLTLVTDAGETPLTDRAVFLPQTRFAYVKAARKHTKILCAVTNPIYFA